MAQWHYEEAVGGKANHATWTVWQASNRWDQCVGIGGGRFVFVDELICEHLRIHPHTSAAAAAAAAAPKDAMG